jgi:hypothetical protein
MESRSKIKIREALVMSKMSVVKHGMFKGIHRKSNVLSEKR